MNQAFDAAFGAIMGTVLAVFCAVGLVLLAMLAFDWWIARTRRLEFDRNPWNDGYVPALFDPQPEQPPQAPPEAAVESWWVPMDNWDRLQ